MQITTILMLDDGTIDAVEGGVRVFQGHLTRDQVERATECSSYPRRAIAEIYEEGRLTGYFVTFSNAEEETAESGPEWLDEPQIRGTQFTPEHAYCGQLSYEVVLHETEQID